MIGPSGFKPMLITGILIVAPLSLFLSFNSKVTYFSNLVLQ